MLVVALLAFSFQGAGQKGVPTGSDGPLLIRYVLTAAVELIAVLWVAFGLRLRKTPFRSLFGTFPNNASAFGKEIVVAVLFWFASMFVLGSLSITWAVVETKIYQHKIQVQSSDHNTTVTKPTSPEQEQKQMAQKLMTMAPSNTLECFAWGALCLLVGFSEELIFRGYLQTQCIAFLRYIPFGVIAAAIIFGAAHGYQGLRGICLITVYGALFGIIALLRRNLFPGMLAHAWHDFATGMLLAFLRSSHLLDKLSQSS